MLRRLPAGEGRRMFETAGEQGVDTLTDRVRGQQDLSVP
jgi:hypothetical protein